MTGNDSKEKRSRISNFKINPFYLKFEKNFFFLTHHLCLSVHTVSKSMLQQTPLNEFVDYIKSSGWGWDLFRRKVKAK